MTLICWNQTNSIPIENLATLTNNHGLMPI